MFATVRILRKIFGLMRDLTLKSTKHLLVNVEEEGCEFLASLDHLEIGGRLVPWALNGEGINNGVSTALGVGLTGNSSQVFGDLANITLHGED